MNAIVYEVIVRERGSWVSLTCRRFTCQGEAAAAVQRWLEVLDLYKFQVVVRLQLDFLGNRVVTEIWDSIRWRALSGTEGERA